MPSKTSCFRLKRFVRFYYGNLEIQYNSIRLSPRYKINGQIMNGPPTLPWNPCLDIYHVTWRQSSGRGTANINKSTHLFLKAPLLRANGSPVFVSSLSVTLCWQLRIHPDRSCRSGPVDCAQAWHCVFS